MKYLIALLAIVTAPAFAQQQPPEVIALGNKLIAEINSGITCQAQVITLKQQLDAAQAKIKELEEKLNAKQ